MPRLLVSWIGQTDLDACRGVAKAGIGPIGQALDQREFEEVVLLCNYPAVDAQAFEAWATPRTSAKLSVRTIDLKDDPTDYLAIYQAVEPVLAELTRRKGVQLSLHLSPGTPAMGAIWLLLGKTRYPAELLQSSRESGVRTAAVPFDIAAEFIDRAQGAMQVADAALRARAGGELPEAPRFGDIIYRGRAMEHVIERAKKVAPRTVAVLIEGESGTGKELLARAIHAESGRARKPFIAVNCGAIPANLVESELFGHAKGAFTGATESARGKFREADGGTLFLDELGELPLDAQVKLLRAVQEGEVSGVGESRSHAVDVRIVAATNRNLALEVQARRFREDLFYRLAVALLHLPPLRERKGDLRPLIDALLEKANSKGKKEEPRYRAKTLSPGARNALLNYPWPGNVRELENTLMRATVWSDEAVLSERDVRDALLQGSSSPSIGGGALPDLGPGFKLNDVLLELSRPYVEQALRHTANNKTQAAKLLGLGSPQVLGERMEKLGIQALKPGA
ncbi:MAG: sigma-54 dependent transcriptional regulator [Polyangiaceae bacterium]